MLGVVSPVSRICTPDSIKARGSGEKLLCFDSDNKRTTSLDFGGVVLGDVPKVLNRRAGDGIRTHEW